MIPSRPLDLVGIISEAIRIVTKTYWRAAIVVLVFCAPGFIVMQFGIIELLNNAQEIAREFTTVSPESPALIRDYLFVNNKTSSQPSIIYYRLQYPDFFKVVDSVSSSVLMQYPDSASRTTLESRIDSISDIVRVRHSHEPGPSIYSGLIILLTGFVIMFLGLIGSIAARYDLSSRAYEDRSLHLGSVFRFAMRRTLWLFIVQYFIVGFALLFGFGMIVGITFTISPVFGAFGILASVIIIIYTLMRILFSRIALVSEEMGPFEAIKRGLDLTKNSFARILGITIICGILIFIASMILQIPFSFMFSPKMEWLVAFLRGKIDIAKTFADISANIRGWEFVYVISALLSASFGSAFITTIYYDLRTRKEGILEYHEHE